MRASTIINKKKALEAIELNYGRIRPALQEIGLGKSQFYQWLKNDAEFEAAYKSILNERQTIIASKLAILVKQENPKAFLRMLKDIRTKLVRKNS
jgi:hypothetical protein